MKRRVKIYKFEIHGPRSLIVFKMACGSKVNTVDFGTYPYGQEDLCVEFKESSPHGRLRKLGLGESDCKDLFRMTQTSSLSIDEKKEKWSSIIGKMYSPDSIADELQMYIPRYLSVFFNLISSNFPTLSPDFKLVLGVDDFGKVVGFPIDERVLYESHFLPQLINSILESFFDANPFLKSQVSSKKIKDCIDISFKKVKNIPLYPKDDSRNTSVASGDGVFERELRKEEMWKKNRKNFLKKKIRFDILTNFYKRPMNTCMKCPNFLQQYKDWCIELSFSVVDPRIEESLENTIANVIPHLRKIENTPQLQRENLPDFFAPGEISANKNDISHPAYWITRFREEQVNNIISRFAPIKKNLVRPRPYMKWLFSRDYEFFYSQIDTDEDESTGIYICEITFCAFQIRQILTDLAKASPACVEGNDLEFTSSETIFWYFNKLGERVFRFRKMAEDGPYNDCVEE